MACSPVPKVGGAAAPSAPPVPTPMRKSMQITKKTRRGSEPCRNLCKLNVYQTHKDVYNQIHSGKKQLLHAVSGTSSAWTWTSESGGAWILAVDEFSRHKAGELVVARTLDQKSLQDHFTLHSCPSSRAEEQEISTSFPYLHRVVMYTMYIECTVPL